jgi:catechol 2,3-dioxygenase-like lactoylglutathione lyase family enzyme
MNAILDSVYIACADLAAVAPYERLGLTLTPSADGRRILHVGLGERRFQVHFLADAASRPLLHDSLHDAKRRGAGLFAVGLRVADLSTEIVRLRSRGVPVVQGDNPNPPMAYLPLHDQAAVNLLLIQDGPTMAGAPNHSFPLLRLDHLATVAHDLEVRTRFWTDVLGVPVTGEVRTQALLIRQLRLGDAVLELLGAASADSPIHQRPAGIVSMASWEVADLSGAVAQARAAGFTVSDPAPGLLPGTHIATIQGGELAGLNMQLLQYV